MTKHYSYAALLRQREVLAALTLGLVTVMAGVGIELTLTSQRTTIDPAVQRLIEPLDPLLDLKTVERLEGYQNLTLETARAAVREQSLRPAVTVEETLPLQDQEEIVPEESASSSAEVLPE